MKRKPNLQVLPGKRTRSISEKRKSPQAINLKSQRTFAFSISDRSKPNQMDSFLALRPIKGPTTHRLPAPVQAKIIELFFKGHTFREIAKRLHRDAHTVSLICRTPEVTQKLENLKERLLGNSETWIESIDHRVENETNGEMAFRLLERFGVIPSLKEISSGEFRKK